MPTTKPNKFVAPPDADKATPPAARPVATRKVALSSKIPMPMPVAKPAATSALASAAKSAASKRLKPKKLKLVRDSFTIPKLEYLMLDALKLRAATLEKSVKKSELVRAGIKALATMPDSQFLAAIKTVASIKTSHSAKD